MVQYIRVKGGLLNEAERTYEQQLQEMIRSVDAEGAKVVNELRTEAGKELAKVLILG